MRVKVALVYATWNRTALLERSLRQVAELSWPDEVIVVDDGGQDGCELLCARARDWLPASDVKYVYNNQPSECMVSLARNLGVRSTDCDLIVTCEPEVMFMTDVIDQFRRQHAVDQEAGEQRVLNAGIVHKEWQSPGLAPEILVGWQAYFCAAFRREWVEEVGGWDEEFPDGWGWDDVDMGTRLRLNGVGQHNMREVQVRHQWHSMRNCDQLPNERYFHAKGFEDGRRDKVVANQSHEWGRILP